MAAGGHPVTVLGFLLAPRLRAWPALLVLLLGGAVMTTVAALRGTEYDEAYTIFLSAGTPRPDWPVDAFTAASVRHFYSGASTAAGIAHDLRDTDVHPPLYFWAVAMWRGAFGSGLLITRMASVVFSLAALLWIGAIAVLARVPPVAAMLLTVGCYMFACTGQLARGFALAELLSAAGFAFLLLAERRRRHAMWLAGGGGLLLGLATAANYLTAFAGAAALLWLLLRRPRDTRLWLVAGAGFALMLPMDLWFFLAQRGSRADQFPPFDLIPGIRLLAEYAAAGVFGGLPLVIPAPAGPLVAGILAASVAGMAALIALRWRGIGTSGGRLLLGMGVFALPLGLLLLGFTFDNLPIELRYFTFSMPFFGLLTAGAAASLSRRWQQRLLLGAVFAVQAASLTCLAIAPETRQGQQATADVSAAFADAGTVVLVPRGNDGVGVIASFVADAPDDLNILAVGWTDSATDLLARTAGFDRVVLALLGLDADSKATIPLMKSTFELAPCWRAGPRQDGVEIFDRVCHQLVQSDRRLD